jgi:endopeptidase La
MLLEKIVSYENIITDTFIIINDYKKFKILTSGEVSQCINELNSLLDEVRLLQLFLKDNNDTYDVDNIIIDIQNINNKLSSIIKKYGTKNVDDMINICLGQEFLLKNKTEHSDYFDIITKYFHPISYKLIHNKKQKTKNDKPPSKILEDIRICEKGENCTFYDLQSSNTSTKITIFGVKLLLQDSDGNKSLLISGYIDDIIIDYAMSNPFLLNKYYQLKQNKPETSVFENSNFDIFLKTLSIKDYLINDTNGIYDKYMGYINNVQLIKNKTLTKNVNDFLKSEFIEKRNTLIQLLLQGNNSEYQYLSYLLYDSICVDDKSSEDSDEQLLLYESLPWVIKSKFKSAMKQTLEYTNDLLNYDVNNRLPLEQRICLLKTNDKVKEKAMVKLKEVKSKTDDSGTKARQYLDGLLKIPFGVNRKEPIFDVKSNTISQLQKIMKNESYVKYTSQFSVKDKISSLEIKQITDMILSNIGLNNNIDKIETIQKCMKKKKKKELYELLQQIQDLLTTKNLYNSDLAIDLYNSNNWQSQNKDFLKNKIDTLLNNLINREEIVDEIIINNSILEPTVLSLYNDIKSIYKNDNIIADYMTNVKDILDESVYGHDDAKRQVERVIGQWVSGNLNGYCLGFEGPPGVGKTSMAKNGLSQCLKDDQGESRPFSFIAIGGSSNGSTLEGHNYTYVGSTWGRIVDILIEQKCMNPIIFIDELDKVSRTESGREIISILTHLIDPTQNDTFQDKYFSGIDLDLSKILFVFSYNDIEVIDRILLDRIHRIKFDHLTVQDKLIICKDHMLPEIYDTMGQCDNIVFSEEVLKFIIEKYTYESGVRKLKEILYEIVGEVNLTILKNEKNTYELPINITVDDIQNKYLKKRHYLREPSVHPEPTVGIITGLWANAMGKGGIIPIQSSFILSSSLLELKLTGMQGDVMKESMNVAKTLAWSLTDDDKKEELIKKFEKTKTQGIHIHCPEGAVPKDGPSAGTAITVTLYSLLNNKKIKNTIAITGEMNLQGRVTAIGGLDLKILGGIRAGVKTFVFPKDNEKDYHDFLEKYSKNVNIDGISFHAIETIDEALKYSIEE